MKAYAHLYNILLNFS